MPREIADQTVQFAMQPSQLQASEAQRCNVVVDCTANFAAAACYVCYARASYAASAYAHGATETKMSCMKGQL